jgi:hypothetical protein
VTIDLWSCTPHDVQSLMAGETDVEVLRALNDLETAIVTGDEEARVDAVDRLQWRCIVELGRWG